MGVLGILAHDPLGDDDPFGRETKYFSRMIELAGQRGMLAYVFSPQAMSCAQPLMGIGASLAGMSARKSGWVKQEYPRPQVIYDRFSPTSAIEKGVIASFRREALAAGVQFVNSPKFLGLAADKWLTYRALAVHPGLRASLPETARLTPLTLDNMIGSFGHVYVKPVSGRQSRGVVSLRLAADSLETHRVGHDGRVVSETVGRGELHDLRWLTGCAGPDACSDFVVQRAVAPASFHNMRFEIRVMMHKRPSGAWLRTAMVVRAGDSALPFLVSGQERHFRPSSVVPKVFGRRSHEILEAVRGISRPIPALLEMHSGSAGEVAVDVIVDGRGRPWLLEINSRPASLLLNVGSVRLRNLGIERVLDYAESLM